MTIAGTNAPFRAEHLGSLLRPVPLLQAREKAENQKGQVTAQELDTITDKAVDDAIAMQAQLGMHAITDGEYRRGMFWGELFQTMNGMEEIDNAHVSMFRQYVPDIMVFHEMGGWGRTCVCTGKISHTGQSSLVKEWTYTRDQVAKLPGKEHEGKLTMISPVWYHLRYRQGKAYPADVYANDKEYFADIAKAYRAELDILYDAGVRNIQVDDPNFAYFCSQKMIDGWAADKENECTLDELLDTYIAAYNDCFSAHSDRIHFGLHICRGNFKGSRHFSEGGYDRIATKLFQELCFKTYYLEYDTERSGGFEPLQQLPKDKRVVLGVISSKFNTMEDQSAMVQRVRQAAEHMAKGSGETPEQALQRLSVSPQCGFASHEEGNAIDWDGMRAKLKLVRDIADDMWKGEP